MKPQKKYRVVEVTVERMRYSVVFADAEPISVRLATLRATLLWMRGQDPISTAKAAIERAKSQMKMVEEMRLSTVSEDVAAPAYR